MADEEPKKEPDKTGEDAELAKFREELREACDTARRGRCDAIRAFFCNHRDIPEKFRGNEDRTYGFFYATTILKTLGADEGMDVVLEARVCDDREAATAYYLVSGTEIQYGNKKAAGVLVRRELARQCATMVDLVTKAMKLDVDPGQHHSLTALIEECKWCAREVCNVKERNNGST